MDIKLGIAVLLLYFGLLIGIGVRSRSKVKGASDFNIGGRSIGLWVTALSFVAAYFSSVLIIGGGAFGYRFGMATIWIAAVNVLIGATLCWIVLGKRVRGETERLGAQTLSEYFAKRYDSAASGIFSSAVVALFLILYNVGVLKGMANTFEGMMHMPYWLGVVISGAVILFYVFIGGYHAVVWTSFVQACVMIFSLLMLAWFTLKEVGGLTALHTKLAAVDTKTPLGLLATPGEWGWAGLISFALITSLGVWAMPQLVVRFYSIKNEKLLRVGTIVATVAAASAVIPYLCGAAARVLVDPSMVKTPDLAIPVLTEQVLPSLGSAIFMAGVIAAGMSTFAGVLIVISGSVVRDILKSGMKKKFDEEKEVKISRIFALSVGLVSVLIALRPPALILVIAAFAWAVIASTNFWPLVFGLYWKRANGKGAFASMVAGVAAALLWSLLKFPFGIHAYIVGTIVGLIVIVAVSMATGGKAEA